jgi:hypothetical protein
MNVHNRSHQDSSAKLISKLLEQSLWSFRDSEVDRGRLHKKEYHDDELQLMEGHSTENSFSASFEILMYSELVEGHAYTLAKRGKYREPGETLRKLVEGDIFKKEEFHHWFLENSANYPKLTSYLLVIDCLRYRMIEYLTSIMQSE